jgi:hypothetical protein
MPKPTISIQDALARARSISGTEGYLARHRQILQGPFLLCGPLKVGVETSLTMATGKDGMAYLNLDVDFFSHRKTLRLIARLGQEGPTYLFRLWSYAAKHHAEDGSLKDYLIEELEKFAEWTGQKGLLIESLQAVGFLDVLPEGGYKIHDWADHAGHLIAFKIRSVSANQKRWNKYKGTPEGIQQGLQQGVLQGVPMDHPTRSPKTDVKDSFSVPPNLTIPNLTIPKKISTRRQALEDFTVTDKIRDWARKEFSVEIPDDTLTEFKDHWRKEPDKKLRTDWTATFQGNIRKLVGWGILKPKSTPRPTQQPQRYRPTKVVL